MTGTALPAIQLLGIAVGLAMDAFAVSIGVGLDLERIGPRHIFRLAFHFGLFQFLMPLAGWFCGSELRTFLGSTAPWIAFILLLVIGARMFMAAFKEDGEPKGDPTRGLSLVILSVATSVDAFCVGFSLAALGIDVWTPAVVIGIVAAALTTVGISAGRRLGRAYGRRASMAGGLLLIGIGGKILLEHCL